MMDDDEHTGALIRLQTRLEAYEELKAEIEPWRMEDRDLSAREALDNVIARVDAEIVELHRRREAVAHDSKRGARLPDANRA
jgi:hypothetical protein